MSISEPVSLEEIHDVLGEINDHLTDKPNWDAVAALSLYLIALTVTRILEMREQQS